MEVSDFTLRLIVEECCRSLYYDSSERQFSFQLRPSLERIWNKFQTDIQNHDPSFYLDDFNHILSHLEQLSERYQRAPCHGIADGDLLPGEVLEIKLKHSDSSLVLVKMKDGQYLNIANGKGLTLGHHVVFSANRAIQTAENELLGECDHLYLWLPCAEHIMVSQVFVGNYYCRPISRSLWPIFEEAMRIHHSCQSCSCNSLLKASQELGIGAFPLLSILKAVSSSSLNE